MYFKILTKLFFLALVWITVACQTIPEPAPENDPLLTRLFSRDIPTHNKALEEFRQKSSQAKKTVPKLLKYTKDKDGYTRFVALKALGKMQAESAMASFVIALADRYLPARNIATKSLAMLYPKSLTDLKKALSHKNHLVRSGSVQALNIVGERAEEVIPVLITALDDPHPEVRAPGATLLGKMKEKARPALDRLIDALKDSDANVKKCATDALSQIFPHLSVVLAPKLTKALNAKNPETKIGAARVMGKMGARAVKYLLPVLKNQSYDVRLAVAQTILQNVGDDYNSTVRAIVTAFKDETPYIRDKMANAVARLGSKTLAVLFSLLNSDDPKTKAFAALALSGLKENAISSLETLITLLLHDDMEVRKFCARAIGEIGLKGAKAAKSLVLLLADDHIEVRIDAARALGKVGPAIANPSGTILALTKALEYDTLYDDEPEDELMRTTVTEALGQIATAKTVKPLVKAVQDRNSKVQSSAVIALTKVGKQAIAELLPILETDNQALKIVVVLVLAKIGEKTPQVIAAMLELAKQKNPKLQATAIHCLSKIKAREEKVIDALIVALKDKSRYVRTIAARTLGEMGPTAKKAIADLKIAAKDRHYYRVQEEAQKALKKIEAN